MKRAARLVLLTVASSAATATAQSLGNAFNYQGRLTESGQPASGLFDLQVCLFDSSANPVPIGCAPDFNDIPVEVGVFTLALDFGAAPFVGQQRFLELRVRPGASAAGYTILAPRQLLRPAPEALRANVASAAPWSGLSGMPAGFADGIDNNSGGTVTSITAGTGLSGGSIAGVGTIAIADGGVGSAQLATGAVASLQIADGNIAAIDIAGEAIGAGQIASNAVGAPELADNAVDTVAVQNLAITQGKLAAGAVGLTQINTTQVQARISTSCAVGEYFRGVNVNGSVACEPVPGVPRISTVDDPANLVGQFASMAIGSDGRPVISYYDSTAGALKVAQCGNAACTGAATVTSVDDPVNNVGEYTSIAVGGDGLPVISYRDVTASALKVAKCVNAACTGVSTITTVDDPVNSVGRFTSIAIGSDGLPVISHWDSTAGALKVAKCVNAACTGAATITAVDDPVNNVGLSTSIAIGSDGRPVISYADLNAGTLKVAKCGNAACTGTAVITIVDDPANAVGNDTSIAIGSDGLPVISHWDTTAGALKVAKCSNISCTGVATNSTIDDPINDVGAHTDIAIGGDGLPVISYRDVTSGVVKVARCANAACTGVATITTADDPANGAGDFTSIEIGADGLPVISYRDVFAGALKVVKCGTRSCL